jgi:hypothetical protein
MATASLDILHTAALRLREAADRFVVAFERVAAEAAVPEAPEPRPVASKHQRKGKAQSPETVAILALAARPQGVVASEAAKAIDRNMSNASARLLDLVERGKLVPAQSNYSARGKVRYFLTSEAAETWAAEQGPPAVEAHQPSEYPSRVEAFPERRPTPEVCDLAAMVEADAPAVAAALAVIAPQPVPSAPAPKPYIPPTPSRARGERREALTAAAFVAPIAKPTGEMIVPPTAKHTVAPTPVDGRFSADPETLGKDPESFSAQWARLRGLSA